VGRRGLSLRARCTTHLSAGTRTFWRPLQVFRRKSLRGSFLHFYAYGALAFALTGVLARLDNLTAALLLPYLGYLAYATWWGYSLWRLNEPEVCRAD
jgi:tryptophan-rich sensory protein